MPPKAAPENISNREYYSTIGDNDSPEEDIMSLSSNSSPNKKDEGTSSPAKAENKLYSESHGSLVEVKRAETPSPTPSDIILQLDHGFMHELTAAYDQMKKDGVEPEQIKKRLYELLAELEAGLEVGGSRSEQPAQESTGDQSDSQK